MIGTVTLNPCIDYFMEVPRIIPDDISRSTSIRFEAAGKGVNVARVLTVLGSEALALCPVGGELGSYWARLMRAEGLRFKTLRVHAPIRLNVNVRASNIPQGIRLNARGSFMTASQIRQFKQMMLRCKGVKTWVLTGSLPPGCPDSLYREWIRDFSKRGARLVLDSDGQSLKFGLNANPWLVKLNGHEFERLTGLKTQNRAQIVKKARALMKRGIRWVIVSLGARGALFLNQDERPVGFKVPAVKVRATTVGAGDTMLAAFLHSEAKGSSGLRMAEDAMVASLLHVSGQTINLDSKASRVWRKRLKREFF